jgi:hypothetical protein
MKKLLISLTLLAASFTTVPAALAQVPISGSTGTFTGQVSAGSFLGTSILTNYGSVNSNPSSGVVGGTSAAYTGWGKNATGDMDFIAANNGSSPSFYWYFLLGASTLTPEMWLDNSANLHVPNGGITTQSVTATVSYVIPHYTVATLPSPVTLGLGGTVIVSDCTAYTPGALCTGGGSDVMIGVSNGTNWTVH